MVYWAENKIKRGCMDIWSAEVEFGERDWNIGDGGVVHVNGEAGAGSILAPGGGGIFRVSGCVRLLGEEDVVRTGTRVVCLGECATGPGAVGCEVRKEGAAVAWVTLSDKGSRGEREDLSGPRLEELARKALPVCFTQGFLLPDEKEALRALLVDLALFQRFDLVLTTGGTGVGPRDITPEVTLAVIDKRLPGFEHAMAAASMPKTPHAMISRAVAGVLSRCLIVNMPGSVKAVEEIMEAISPALGHALDKLRGDSTDCARA